MFEAALPTPPPSMSSQESLDSFASSTPTMVATPPPVQGKEAARNNIIRELVETERKFVVDLETMQVRF